VSFDEASAPQTPAELLFILAALAREAIPVATVAPKFTGEFLKGIDYVGDIKRSRGNSRKISPSWSCQAELHFAAGAQVEHSLGQRQSFRCTRSCIEQSRRPARVST